jgi:hypothetical protein
MFSRSRAKSKEADKVRLGGDVRWAWVDLWAAGRTRTAQWRRSRRPSATQNPVHQAAGRTGRSRLPIQSAREYAAHDWS